MAEAVQPLVLAIRRVQVSSRFSIKSPGVNFFIIALAHSAAESAIGLCIFLEEFLDKRTMKALVVEMREAACELEDALDSLVSEQFHSQSETEDELIALDLQGVRQDVDVFTQKMMKLHRVFNPWFLEELDILPGFRVSRSRLMSWYATKAASVFLGTKEDYIQDLQNLLPEEDDDFGFLLSSDESRYSKIKHRLSSWWTDKAASFFMADCIQELPKQAVDSVSSHMVGLTALFCEIRDGLIDDKSNVVHPISGMAGIGKTALAKKILQDPLISSKFECRIFVRMGPKYEWEEIVRAIAAQLGPDADEMLKRGNEDLQDHLHKTFKVKKSLIVLDDVWNRRIYDDLHTIITYRNNISKVLVTSRRASVAETVSTLVYQVLRNLMILLDVGAHTCTKYVVKSVPNLWKLRVHDIESSEFDAALPPSFYDDISHLKELRSLQYLVMHPNLISVAAAPAPSLYASRLIKLTLSGCGYSWKDMNKISELPLLRVLKLKYYAFRGEKWRVEEWEFPCLEYLSIEDTDLVQWTGGNQIFPELDILSIKNCYKLQEIPKLSSPIEVRLVDCNPSATSFVRTVASDRCSISVHSSWLDDEHSKP